MFEMTEEGWIVVDVRDISDITTDTQVVKERMMLVGGLVANGWKVVIRCIAGINRCYDEKTQVLTKSGFKYFKDLLCDDKILTLNILNNQMEYQKPLKFFAYDYNGKMVYIKHKSLSLLVTPNHNILCEKPKGGKRIYSNKWSFVRADRKYSCMKIPRTAFWEGEKEEYFVLPLHKKKMGMLRPEVKIPMDVFLALLGIYLSEGCLVRCGSYNSIQIAQKNTEKRQLIEEMLKRLPFNYSKDKQSFRIYSIQLYKYFKQFGKAKDKFIPRELKNLPPENLKVLLHWLILGDGHEYKTRFVYASSSPKLLDDVQEIAIKCGLKSNLIKDGRGGFQVSISKGPSITSHVDTRNYSEIDYSGMVYCIEVPNHSMLIRREGKTCFSGNSNVLACGVMCMLEPKDDLDEAWNKHWTTVRKKVLRSLANPILYDTVKKVLWETKRFKTWDKVKMKCIICGREVQEFCHGRRCIDCCRKLAELEEEIYKENE